MTLKKVLKNQQLTDNNNNMEYTRNRIKECRAMINDARTDIKNGNREAADMQLDYINKVLGSVLSSWLDIDSKEIRFQGRMEGIDSLDRRLDDVFSNLKDQLQSGEGNLSL
jgi:hypothetical protein